MGYKKQMKLLPMKKKNAFKPYTVQNNKISNNYNTFNTKLEPTVNWFNNDILIETIENKNQKKEQSNLFDFSVDENKTSKEIPLFEFPKDNTLFNFSQEQSQPSIDNTLFNFSQEQSQPQPIDNTPITTSAVDWTCNNSLKKENTNLKKRY